MPSAECTEVAVRSNSGSPSVPVAPLQSMDCAESSGRELMNHCAHDQRAAGHSKLRGAALAGGIFAFLLSYGFFQEKIMTEDAQHAKKN